MPRYIMALDAGTSSSRCILFNHAGEIQASAQKEITQYFPRPGWVEEDPKELWSTMVGVIMEAMAKVGADPIDIAGIGITNQRETTILWEKATGEPIYNAIVWQCRRTTDMVRKIVEEGSGEMIREKTGLVPDPYFSATKIAWILDQVPGARRRAEKGEILFGTVETWLIYKLSAGKVHVTDYSNASRTMLFNIHTLTWDEDLLRLFRIPRPILPKVQPSSHPYGHAEFFGWKVPIAGAAGDQQCALFGQACFHPGDAKNTYGTGAFLLMNTGEKAVTSRHGLLTTIAWGLEEGRVTYALEGSIFVAGSSVQWLRDQLRLIDSAEDTEYLAGKVPSTEGVYVVPAFTGLGAPYWDPDARGIIIGLTRGTNKYHIIRATLESQAYLSYDVLMAMSQDLGRPLKVLKVDGGAAANNFLMGFQADLVQTPVIRPKILETTALGAAYLAGLAVGYWHSLEEIQDHGAVDHIFQPKITPADRDKLEENWKKAVARTFHWAKELEQ